MLAVLCLCLLPQDSLDPAPTARELQDHLRLLAGDDLQGRRAGTASADQAAWYLAGALAAAGLEPAGPDGSWFQPFTLDMPPEPGPCSLTLDWEGPEGPGHEEWAGLGTLELSATGVVEAPLVRAGYGMVMESHGMNEFAEAGVRGGIAVVRRYTEFGPDADPGLAALGELRAKIRGARDAGAVGVVLGTHPEDLARGGEAAIPFDAAPGRMDLPVVVVSPEQLAWLEERLAAGVPLRARLQATVLRRKARTWNVLGRVPGRSRETIVLGAHYDHLGWGGEGSLAPGEHAIHNGADDNASGTAVALEVAEALAAGPPPARDILVALWGAEEEGLLGSKAWVDHPTVPREEILANVNLDMVGRLESGAITVGGQQTAEALQAAVVETAPPESDLRYILSPETLPGGGGSDHMSFHSAGIPALFFFSGMHGDYHRPSDDWQKLDYDRMEVLARSVVELLRNLAARPREEFRFVPPPAPQEERVVAGARAWFGSIPDYGASPEGGGMQLAGVSPGGPAEKAGLRKGDIIKAVGDVEIRDIYDFMDALARYKAGETVQVRILRDGQERVVPVRLSSRRSGQ